MKNFRICLKSLQAWIDERFPLTQTFTKHLSGYYVPANLNFWYIFGSLALFILCSQFITGIWLLMFYTPSTRLAFDSIQIIMRDVHYGWLIRYLHTTGASAFLLILYLHMFRSLIYGSYKKPREILWVIGMVLFVLILAEAFFGYLLPWGQMSFWGAQVITSALEAIPLIGKSLALLVRGDFSVSDVTLHRFFALHIIIFPLLILGFIFFHLSALHYVGSNNPSGSELNIKKIPLHPYYTIKDIFGLACFLIIFFSIVFFFPEMKGYFLESANAQPANPLLTPAHIAPMWYMAPFYSILRAIPDKTAGVLTMSASIALLFFLPWFDRSTIKSMRHRSKLSQIFLGLFVISFLGLGFLGTLELTPFRQHVAQGLTVVYFLFFLMIFFVKEKNPPQPPFTKGGEEGELSKKGTVSLFCITILIVSLIFIFMQPAFAKIDSLSADDPSVIHGAELFQNNCSACHSLKYVRPTKNIPAFPAKNTPAFFGVIPPDLSLEVQTRGKDWVSGYLNGFYPDPSRPSGVNNTVYPDTAMPDMLAGLKNQMSPEAFNVVIQDMVNFLSYASDPHQAERLSLGYWVVGFLIILAILLYRLYRSYWKKRIIRR